MRAVALLLLLAFALGCGEDDRNQKAVQKMIEEKVEERLRTYRETRMNRCRREAAQEASTIADSILLEQARLTRDTLSKPPKPTKPERPELKTLKDSLKVAPILRRDSQ